eukprot:Selendium_serpulae@DN5944_c1_g1_i11.p3
MTTEMGTEHMSAWYASIQELREEVPGLKVIGVVYDIPDWKQILTLWRKYKGTFDGVMLEWIANGSCIDLVSVPDPETIEELTVNTDGKIRYFFRDQDPQLCDTVANDYINIPGHDKSFQIPDYLQPVFSCMGRNTGECYKAFTHPDYLDAHCDATMQRYIFNPFSDTGGRLLHLLNQTCGGTPPHDLYGAV